MKLYLLIGLFLVAMRQTDIVVVQTSELILYKGKPATLVLNITIRPGYHIQSNQPRDEFLIPTSVVFESDKNLEPGKADFPEPKKFRLENSDDWMDVFDSSFQIKIPVQVVKQVEKGSYNLNARLHYQACDTRTCFFPKDISFTVQYSVK